MPKSTSMSQPPIHNHIKQILESFPEVTLGILFGSLAENKQRFDSDLDIAVAGNKALSSDEKKALITALADKVNRPIDLVDLRQINGTLLHQALTKGTLIYCLDRNLYATLIKKMLYNQADMMPYHYRILKERRERWINE